MKEYRKNVGVVVFNAKGLVLLGNRISHRSSWQFPQGGMDDNEDPLVAAKRELYEEVGIDNAEFVYERSDAKMVFSLLGLSCFQLQIRCA